MESSLEANFKGPFWHTPLGRAVSEFTNKKLSDVRFPTGTGKVEQLLGLPKFTTATLAKSGLIGKVEQAGRYYDFQLPHVLNTGLCFLLLDRYYPLAEVQPTLERLLDDTFLRPFIGTLSHRGSVKYLRRPNKGFFLPNSPWGDFPLDIRKIEETEHGNQIHALTFEGAEIRADESQPHSPFNQPLLERVPEIKDHQKDMLRNCQKTTLDIIWRWINSYPACDEVHYKKLGQMLTGNNGSSTEAISAALVLARVVMFIAAADALGHQISRSASPEYPDSYDPKSNEWLNGPLKTGTELCLKYMEYHPEYDDLGTLYEKVQQGLKRQVLSCPRSS